MKEYKAVDMYFEDSLDYVKDLNFLFSKGWEFVKDIEIGNARGGKGYAVILCKDKKENKSAILDEAYDLCDDQSIHQKNRRITYLN